MMFLHSSLKPKNGNKNVKFIRYVHCLKNFAARMDVDPETGIGKPTQPWSDQGSVGILNYAMPDKF
jgi:hypothetical protein